MERVDPSWQTRSTEPMSMPSSSEAVATSALSSPRFQTIFRFKPQLGGEAAVVRHDFVLAEAVAELMR